MQLMVFFLMLQFFSMLHFIVTLFIIINGRKKVFPVYTQLDIATRSDIMVKITKYLVKSLTYCFFTLHHKNYFKMQF